MAADRSDRIILFVGASLLALYVAQGVLHLECSALVQVQDDDRYRVISGCMLAVYLLHQSFMARRRVFDPVGVVFWHRLAGALAPVVLYLHASRFGYGYLFVLVSLFIGTIGFGLLHSVVLRVRLRWLFTWWFVLHVATSASLVVLSGYHVLVALAYE
ncbi:MAG: hypothetical protein HOV81_26470 [Kofleriaceae bacterium]|nr:hypothetical protein [Kofleriaceae bacterium]